jgi:DNA polymerase-3 subunit alpha
VGRFVSLHHHSTFSYQDGFRQPEEHVKRAAELGMEAMALTEHGNVTSHVKLERAALEAGIKPIFGVEAYTGGVGENASRYKWHLTMLAQTQTGLANLYEMVSRGWAEGYYYEPTISGDMLAELHEGVIVLSGCSGSKLAVDLLGGKGTPLHKADIQAATRTAEKFRELLGDRYYLEVQAFPELERTKAINESYLRISEKTGIPIVVTTDVHYPHAHDNEMQLLIHAIDRGGKNNTIEKQAQGWGYDIPLVDHPDKVLVKKLRATGFSKSEAWAAIETSNEIAQRIDVKLPRLEDLKYTGSIDASKEQFRQAIRDGWVYRGFDRLPTKTRKEYSRRLKYEMEMIEEKGFVDYFLTVADVVIFAKSNGIPVGPARGSAAASLVCFIMRITEVNPMFFPNLIFERFIDINRHDLPDIDLDFDDERRYLIREYLVMKYGEERVGNIGTFTKYKGKNSIDDVARVYQIPKFATDGVKEMLIERSSGDLRAGATIEDTIEMFPKVKDIFDKYPALYKAQQLEGNLRGFSVHAAGLVVANDPLTNSVAVYRRFDQKGNVIGEVLSIDKHDAEYINALKIDVLGLTTMGMIRRCLEMIGMTLEELYAVPLDDEKVFDGFRRNEVIGVFQFDGRAMRSVNREVKPDTFAEVCDINALARPGPLHSGAAAEYIMVKHGKKKVEILHPVVARITAHTNQQIVYQEQILQVVRELGNFTWEEAALIRKLISKKQGEQAFNRMMDKFVKGAMENGLNEQNAVKVWKQLVTAGAYAFNAAHCVSYGMLAYWTMWLKQNYPLEFYCAALQKYDPKTKGFDLLKEAMLDKGIEVLPPDPIESDITWSFDKAGNSLRAGFLQVSGIGEKTAVPMLEFREKWLADGNDPSDFTWDHYTAVRGIGPVAMRKVREFVEDPDPFGVHVMGQTLRKVRRRLYNEEDILGIPYPYSKSEDVPYEAITGAHIWSGIVRERNLKDIYELHRSRTGEELDPKTVREPKYVNYVVVTGEDETGPLVITIPRFGGLYERYKDLIWNMDVKRDILVVEGYKRREYRRAITAKKIWVINPEKF